MLEDFLDLAKDGKTSFKDPYLFLKTSKEAIENLSRDERREAASRIGATDILLWLWGQTHDKS